LGNADGNFPRSG
jgi:hypothetical protein